MSSRKEHLDLAIARAKQRLSDTGAATAFPEEETQHNNQTQPPKSRLNQLLGKRTVPIPKQGTLLQRVGVVQRPTYDLVADAVLGKASRKHQPALNLVSDDESLATIVANRLRSLRERTGDSISEEYTTPTDDDLSLIHI